MRISRASIAPVVAVFCIVVTKGDAAQPQPAGAEAELRRITQEMMDALAPGHAEVWDRYLDERLIHVDENGTVRGKRELLAELKPLPPGLIGHIEVDRFRTEQHGDTAVAAYEVQEHLDYHGQILRSRFRTSDTWLKTRGVWKLIGSQTAAVLKDPPEVALTRAQLCNYNGTYALTDAITTTIGCAGGGLSSERTGRPPATYRAETADVFFVPGEPRTRRIFQRDADGKVTGFVDRREGEDILWHRVPVSQSP